MRKTISFLLLFALVTAACKKDKDGSGNLSCDELKKRMEQKGDAYDVDDKATCMAYAESIDAYAKAKCLSDGENRAMEVLAMSVKALCD